jgi:hypothetical protein
VIPTQEPQQHVDQFPVTRLDLTVVPGAPGQTEVFFDDGLSLGQPPERLGLFYDGKRTLKIVKPAGPFLDRLRLLGIKVAAQGADGVRFDRGPVHVDQGWAVLEASSGTVSLP